MSFSVVPKATYKASRGPLKGAVSAQKAFEGFDTGTRVLMGGTEENNVSLIWVIDMLSIFLPAEKRHGHAEL